MKKIFALILAIVMMASMSVVVFADEVTAAPNNSDVAGGTTLVYGVKQAYTVTIPASQTFAFDEDEADVNKAFKAAAVVEASGVKIAGNEFFVIKVVSDNGWKLVDENKDTSNSADVNYVATVGERNMATSNVVLSLASTTAVAGAATPEGGVTVNFTTAGTGQEGNYQDLLTFKVEIATTNPLA